MINELICQHLWLAERLAKWKKRAIGTNVTYDELRSAAYYGLVDAAHRFGGQGAFSKYAAVRIRGEIDDYLRELRGWRGVALNDVYVAPVKEDRVATFLALLPKSVADMFSLYLSGATMREIGDRLGVSESSVSRRIGKIRGLVKS